MRLGAWLALGLVAAGAGCAGGYPLPPTRCDEWCDVTKGAQCQEYYEPATCVANCEQADLDDEACRDVFDAQLRCFRSSPRAIEQRCVYDNQPDDCEVESEELLFCVGVQHGTVGFR